MVNGHELIQAQDEDEDQWRALLNMVIDFQVP
jgi:hypothetical protein